jgi:hypothetical protein
LKDAGMKNVLKDYTEFASSPFKKTPTGFTLSKSSVFYKFDTLNCSLFIKKREDVDSLIYYRDCEDGKYCAEKDDEGSVNLNKNNLGKYKKCRGRYEGCCELMIETDTSALYYKNEFVEFQKFLVLDLNLPKSLISNSYVTNNEYKEFVDYCIDSMQRELLLANSSDTSFKFNSKSYHGGRLNYDKKYNPNEKINKIILSELYVPDHEKYYWKKERDWRKIVFSQNYFPSETYFENNNCSKCGKLMMEDECRLGVKGCELKRSELNYSQISNGLYFMHTKNKPNDNKNLENYHRHSRITIYPDTLSWLMVNDKIKSINYNIWASQNYFYSEKFEKMPVQGVNYWQAKAFLDWKTNFHNRQLIRDKSKYMVLY